MSCHTSKPSKVLTFLYLLFHQTKPPRSTKWTPCNSPAHQHRTWTWIKKKNPLVQFNCTLLESLILCQTLWGAGGQREIRQAPCSPRDSFLKYIPFYLSHHSYKSNPGPALSVPGQNYFLCHILHFTVYSSLPFGLVLPPWGNWDFLFHTLLSLLVLSFPLFLLL